MTGLIYVMGAYGFATVTGDYWKAAVWPVYMGKMAGDHFQRMRKAGPRRDDW